MDFIMLIMDVIIDLFSHRSSGGKWKLSILLPLGCIALVILGAVLHVSLLFWIGVTGLLLAVPIGILLVSLEVKDDWDEIKYRIESARHERQKQKEN